MSGRRVIEPTCTVAYLFVGTYLICNPFHVIRRHQVRWGPFQSRWSPSSATEQLVAAEDRLQRVPVYRRWGDKIFLSVVFEAKYSVQSTVQSTSPITRGSTQDRGKLPHWRRCRIQSERNTEYTR